MNIEFILECFPNNVANILKNYLKNGWENNIEEIRIKNKAPIIILNSSEEKILDHIIDENELLHILQRFCENSLYSYQKQIANGYITIKGGNRVGVVGSGVLENEKIINLNYISSLNIRISRQIFNCSESIINEILDKETNTIFNTLIVSPPGVGKTTLLKDIVRNISNGIENFKGIRVVVIDERGEIGASYKGVTQNDLGIRTDILDNVPKAIGMKLAIRSMTPKVIVADEIGNKDDVSSIRYAIRCGVKGIFTAHGASLEELKLNPELSELIEEKVFEKIIIIKKRINSYLDKKVYRMIK